jgi:tRNA dimethylallyltransferase
MGTIRQKPSVVVICGPTAVGKTSVAVALAAAFHGEIISADSMQIYRRMDIGTAKPSAAEQQAARHHLIDVREPDEAFDAAAFARIARQAAEAILSRGRLPLLAGGTGLYIKAFLHGIFESERVDPQTRALLKSEIETQGSAALHRRLARVDPAAAGRIHPNDRFRILRALETIEACGEPISSYHAAHRFEDNRYRALKIGLHMDRESLYRRIDQRVDAMLAAGLEQEVRGLLAAGYGAELKSMQSIGYRHMIEFIEGRISREECVRTLKRDTRRYAKRQFTWFGADGDITWYAPEEIGAMRSHIGKFLSESSYWEPIEGTGRKMRSTTESAKNPKKV